MKRLRTIFSSLSLLASLCLSLNGQTPPLAEDAQDSQQLSRSETISRALEDLGSDNVDTRVGSIMLLGKYEDLLALNGVVQGLRDPPCQGAAGIFGLLD